MAKLIKTAKAITKKKNKVETFTVGLKATFPDPLPKATSSAKVTKIDQKNKTITLETVKPDKLQEAKEIISYLLTRHPEDTGKGIDRAKAFIA